MNTIVIGVIGTMMLITTALMLSGLIRIKKNAVLGILIWMLSLSLFSCENVPDKKPVSASATKQENAASKFSDDIQAVRKGFGMPNTIDTIPGGCVYTYWGTQKSTFYVQAVFNNGILVKFEVDAEHENDYRVNTFMRLVEMNEKKAMLLDEVKSEKLIDYMDSVHETFGIDYSDSGCEIVEDIVKGHYKWDFETVLEYVSKSKREHFTRLYANKYASAYSPE